MAQGGVNCVYTVTVPNSQTSELPPGSCPIQPLTNHVMKPPPPKGLWAPVGILYVYTHLLQQSVLDQLQLLSLSSHGERGKDFRPERAGKSGRCGRNSILPLWSRVGMGSNPGLKKKGTSFILVTPGGNRLTLGASHRLLLASRVTPPAPGGRDTRTLFFSKALETAPVNALFTHFTWEKRAVGHRQNGVSWSLLTSYQHWQKCFVGKSPEGETGSWFCSSASTTQA